MDGPPVATEQATAGLALTALLQALVAPISPCFLTLAYIDARVRKEGYDMEVLAQQTAAAPRAASLAPGHSA